jgi:hypothetical protein
MSAVGKVQLVSVEEYLAAELVSPHKHEYLGGVVYAMAGARNVHNLIASSIRNRTILRCDDSRRANQSS